MEGVFQNFASADDATSGQTAAQQKAFEEMLAAIRAAGHSPSMIHTDTSAAALFARDREDRGEFFESK